MPEKLKLKDDKQKQESTLKKIERTASQKAADKLTILVGSWTFIFTMSVVLIFWVAANVYGFLNQWDPYPFILLNLFLSFLAAYQAPIILMSQNRQTQRDRIKAERDYAINRKAEREIENIQEDLDEIKRMVHLMQPKKRKVAN